MGFVPKTPSSLTRHLTVTCKPVSRKPSNSSRLVGCSSRISDMKSVDRSRDKGPQPHLQRDPTISMKSVSGNASVPLYQWPTLTVCSFRTMHAYRPQIRYRSSGAVVVVMEILDENGSRHQMKISERISAGNRRKGETMNPLAASRSHNISRVLK